MIYHKTFFYFSILLVSCFLLSCKTGQVSPSFKPLKLGTETVALFSPYVENYMNDFDQQRRNSNVEKTNIALISRISKNSISPCFNVRDIPLAPTDLNDFSLLYSAQDTSEEFTKNILNKLFTKYSKAMGNADMAVFISYYGEYPIPEDEVKKDKIIENELIVPSTRPYSDLQIFVFDIKNREVVFYDRIATKKYSPEVYEDVVSMVKKLIKPICNKKIR